jgi:dihydroorotase
MSISINSPADFHVHLRQGAISELITPHVRKGGFGLAYVMVRLLSHIQIISALKSTKAQFKTTYHNNRTSLKV